MRPDPDPRNPALAEDGLIAELEAIAAPRAMDDRAARRSYGDTVKTIGHCLGVARSALSAHERAAALGRAQHLADLIDYDLPPLAAPEQCTAIVPHPAFFSVEETSRSDLARIFRRFDRRLRETAAAAGAAEDEAVVDAQRRNFQIAAAEAAERDRQRACARSSDRNTDPFGLDARR